MSQRRGARPAALALAIVWAHSAAAQTPPRDGGARMERLADGVYALIHDDATHDWPSGATNWPHGNAGVIVGRDAVLVVDSDYFPSRAKADIALIRRVTDKPVRYLVNTHWHGDHTHGNGVYRDAFPGLTIVGAGPNRHYIATNLARWPRMAIAAGSANRATLARLEQLLAAGKDSAGRALSADDRRRLGQVIAEQRSELAELAAVQVAPPTMLFDREMTVDLGGRIVVLRNWDRANSPADVTVYLPAERVLFAGDILVAPVPYVFGAYPVPWLGVLEQIERIPVSAVVPGHGPVMRDHGYTRQVRELLETTRTRLEPLLLQGKTSAEAQRLLDLADLRPRFVRDGDVDAAATWDASIKEALIDRMYQCVVGYRC